MAMATGEAPAEVAATELPEFVKTVQEAVSFCNLLTFTIFYCDFMTRSHPLMYSGTKLKISMQ